MAYGITALHVRGAAPEGVERALTALFADEGRAVALRLEGTFGAVLRRLTDPTLEAAYRYLICRPHPSSAWTPLLELGARADGLEAALSRALGGAEVFAVFAYGDGLSGYRLARGGALLDAYASDPTYFATEPLPAAAIEERRGHPERFADLLPAGTAPEEMARVVLRPGWWEAYDAAALAPGALTPGPSPTAAGEGSQRATGEGGEEQDEVRDEEEEEEMEDVVDEVDRARCIALALELWSPTEYPFARDADELAELPDRAVGPATALAYT
jgi:hypothetical protein